MVTLVRHQSPIGPRFEWATQVNINNLFNHYQVVIMPNGNTGDPRTARFTAEPRAYIWTNSLSF